MDVPEAQHKSSGVLPLVLAYRQGDSLIVQCPFCGMHHVHGAVGAQVGDGDGLRVSHCRDNRRRGYWLREARGSVLWVAA
jgi:hypothetical protein